MDRTMRGKPTTAVAMTVLISTIPMYLLFNASFISTQLNGTFLFTIAWLVSAVAAIVLPFRRRSLFQSSQANTRVMGLPAISWVGVVSLVVLGYLSYNAFTNPAIGPDALVSRLVVLAIIAGGAVVYAISYLYNRRRGIDLNLLSGELPPE